MYSQQGIVNGYYVKALRAIVLQGDTISLVNPTDGQIISRVNGKWTNINGSEYTSIDSLLFRQSNGYLRWYIGGTAIDSTSLDGRYAVALEYMGKNVYDTAGINEQLVGINSVQVLSNKTLVSPFISSYINATHNHTSNTTGGVLNSDNITQGVNNLWSQWTKTGGNIYRNSDVGIGGQPTTKLDVFGTTRTQIMDITNSINFNGLSLTGVSTGLSNNNKLTTQGYVDDAISAAGGYTNEMAQDAVGSILDDGTLDDINFSYNDGTPKITGSVKNDSHNHTGSTISGLSNSNFTSSNISQWTNDAGFVINTFPLSGDLSGTLNNPSVVNDSHTHTWATLPTETQTLQQVINLGNQVTKSTTVSSDSTYLVRTSITQTSGSSTNRLYGFKNYATYSGAQQQLILGGTVTFVNNIGTGLVSAIGGMPLVVNTSNESSATNVYGYTTTITNRGKFNKLSGLSSWIYNYNRDAANNDMYGTVNTFANYGFFDDYSGFQVDAYNEGEMGNFDGLLVGFHGDSLDYMTGVNLGGYTSHYWTGTPKYSRGIFIDKSIDRGTIEKYAILSESTSLSKFSGKIEHPDATENTQSATLGQVKKIVSDSIFANSNGVNQFVQYISYNDTIHFNYNNGNNASIILSGNVNYFTFDSIPDGAEGSILINQNDVGGFDILTYSGNSLNISIEDTTSNYITNVVFSNDTLWIMEKDTFSVRIDGGENNNVQNKSGTTPTLDVNLGLNAKITLSGNTVFTLSNLVAGTEGNITIHCGTFSKTISFSGYSIIISPVLEPDINNAVTINSNSKNVLSWYYDGDYVFINGTRY